jgi:hypothetical protein
MSVTLEYSTLVFIILGKEHPGWQSVGLQRPAVGNRALWVVFTILAVALAIALALGVINPQLCSTDVDGKVPE